jgi:hypothetical protein
MSGDFDKQFDDMMNQFKVVDPLTLPDILEGMRTVMEANLYVGDYLSEFFISIEDVATEQGEELTEEEREIFLEVPAFSHESSVYLRVLFDAAKSFCDTVTREGEEEE